MRSIVAVVMTLALAGCSTLRGDPPWGDGDAVRTPTYSANKVLFMEPDPTNGRYALLKDGYEAVASVNDAKSQGARRSIRNRQPLSIVVSKAYLPATATAQKCGNGRMSDILYSKGRDIAVLLDISASADKQEFIAVWYQQDVPPNEYLSFENLLVYSTDAWDSKFPPYFRMRLVDVSAERNTAVGELLGQIRASSTTITTMVGAPEAGPLLGVASLAASQVLAHERNRALVDYTFQLYGAHLLGEAGGMPLGVLQTGGMLVTARPCGQEETFWSTPLKFDHRLQRITDNAGNVQAMPYIMTTIMTADLAVPQVVRSRTAAITKRLTDPKVVQAEIRDAMQDAQRLSTALGALSERETFRRRPSKAAFAVMVGNVNANWSNIDPVEQGFFLDAFYQISGVSFINAQGYVDWATRCSAAAKFDPETARFNADPNIKDANGVACWS
jgi:hypothetical protein